MSTSAPLVKNDYKGYAKVMVEKGIGFEAFKEKLKNASIDYINAVKEARRTHKLTDEDMMFLYGNHFSFNTYCRFENLSTYPLPWECADAAYKILHVPYPNVCVPLRGNRSETYHLRLGAYFKSAREHCELTQAQVAKKLRKSDALISNMETGKCIPRENELYELMYLYKIEVLPLPQDYDDYYKNYGMDAKGSKWEKEETKAELETQIVDDISEISESDHKEAEYFSKPTKLQVDAKAIIEKDSVINSNNPGLIVISEENTEDEKKYSLNDIDHCYQLYNQIKTKMTSYGSLPEEKNINIFFEVMELFEKFTPDQKKLLTKLI